MNIKKVYSWVYENSNEEVDSYAYKTESHVWLDSYFYSVEEAEKALNKYIELTQFDCAWANYRLVQTYKVEK
jgi:hypothetical protein